MTKRKPSNPTPPSASVAGSVKPPQSIHHFIPSQTAIRETVESVVIAFILAFLFRTFEAEAFVIPTGSMAPTLMGRHKDLECPKCGYPYQVSASEEVDRNEAVKGRESQITSCTCPMCRYTADLGRDYIPSWSERIARATRDKVATLLNVFGIFLKAPPPLCYPSFKGDRVLVGKFSYDFSDPKRWDVVVFKYPGGADTNYIKRLVGLPGETVRIQHGDIWTSRDGKPFQIARKPPERLLAVLQPVFDNDYMPKIAELGWPARWTAAEPSQAETAGVWQASGPSSFATDGTAAGETWLRYHHLVPSYEQWLALKEKKSVRADEMQPQLITDFTAYDTGRNRSSSTTNPAPSGEILGLHWVGDLAMECTVDSKSDTGKIAFELCKGGRRFQCRIDLATGQAALSVTGKDMEQFRPTALTNVRGKGEHRILFSNCDNELHLWVDGSVVAFNAPTTYDDLDNNRPGDSDRTPVGVAADGAQVRIGHLRVMRDLYYIAAQKEKRYDQPISDYESPLFLSQNTTDQIIEKQPRRRFVDFELKPDQFFMLGDNSANSMDGRLWGSEYWVSRNLLIGKAICIYWPHSWDSIRTPWATIPFPMFPNFHRMGMVR